jgi:hypothetical protein
MLGRVLHPSTEAGGDRVGQPEPLTPRMRAWLAAIVAPPWRGATAFAVLTLAVYGAVIVAGALIGRSVQSDQVHYAYLADAFLHGRLDVDPTATSHLIELVPYDGKHYVVYPPMPAVILMPLVAWLGPELPTSLVSILLAALCVGATYMMLRRARFSWEVSAAVTLLFAFGTGFWYTSLKGSSWHFAEVVAVLCLTLALVEAFGPNPRPLLIGLLLGAAVLSRLPMALTLPFFLWITLRDRPAKLGAGAALLVGVGAFVVANMAYNFARYGTVFDVSYVLIPGVLEAPWYAAGIIHWSYLPRNLHALLFQPPILVQSFPYFIPSTFGLSIFIASPAFLLIFLAPARQSWTWIVGGTALLAMLPGLLHGWPGGTQFGYRFALDGGPFLLILTALGMRAGVTVRVALLVGLSIASNLWGLAFARWIPVQWPWPLPDLR